MMYDSRSVSSFHIPNICNLVILNRFQDWPVARARISVYMLYTRNSCCLAFSVCYTNQHTTTINSQTLFSSAETSAKLTMTTCSVCQDQASNLRWFLADDLMTKWMMNNNHCRYYGASSVCTSCRVFFRRTVISKHQYKCINGTSTCVVNKETRAYCK